MASCGARTLGNPRAAAALLRPPYYRASAGTLRPKQFAFPRVPANLGTDFAGWMKTPKAMELLKPEIVALTVFVAESITVTLLESPFTT
jgi:hypothetical protein